MNKPLFIAILIGSLSRLALADHKHVTVHVNGMVCSFCSQGLEKKFKADPTVSKVDVNLDKKIVTVTLKHNAGELSDNWIKDLISAAGYNVEKIERD